MVIRKTIEVIKMKSEIKHLDKTEGCYKIEYALRQDIHCRDGEILRLEYINAKYCREIERLNARISTILETTPDTISDDQIDKITESKDLFEYIKYVIVVLSEKEGNRNVDPSVIDVKYIEAAVRYTMPGLFNIYALIGDEDIHKIELADSILHKFGIETMVKYEELAERGDIGIDILDRRFPHPPKGL